MTTQTEQKSDWKVILKAEAYKKILLHCTRFANYKIPRNEWKEVYGFLTGKIENGDVICNDAVPMTHGGAVEVEFDEQNYIEAATLNEKLAERNEFIVGWYHSHPGLGIFLSSIDIKNHIGYQGINPKAIALVFDHTTLHGGFLGFKIFSLDNPNDENTGYHIVEWVIPDLNEKVFAESLFELSQRITEGRPVIEEYGEMIQPIQETVLRQESQKFESNKDKVSQTQFLADLGEYPSAQKKLQESLKFEAKKDYLKAIEYGLKAGKEFEQKNLIGRASDAYLQVGRYLYEFWEMIQNRIELIKANKKSITFKDIELMETLAGTLFKVLKEKKSEDIGLILEIRSKTGRMVRVKDEKIQIANILWEAAKLCEMKLIHEEDKLPIKEKCKLCLKGASLLSTAIIFARNVSKQINLAKEIFNFEELTYKINKFLIWNQEYTAKEKEEQNDYLTAAEIYKGAAMIAKESAKSFSDENFICNLIGLANFFLGKMCLCIGEHKKYNLKNQCEAAPYYEKSLNFFVKAKESLPSNAIREKNEANIFVEEAKSQFELAKKDCLSKNLQIGKLPEKFKVKTRIIQERPEPLFYP